MRVLSKPDFEDSVRYDELELLLENFGVNRDQQEQNDSSENLQILEDSSASINQNDGVRFIEDNGDEQRPPFEFQKKKTESAKKYQRPNDREKPGTADSQDKAQR